MAINYKQLATQIFNAQNQIRKEPKSFIPKLEKVLAFFEGKVFNDPAENPVQTIEGKDGVLNAITFLQNQGSLEPLLNSGELTTSALDHAKDIGYKGLSSHEGSDGKSITDRIEKYIEWNGAIAESLDFCYKVADNIVMNLVIDDGTEGKHQRANLFNKDFKYVGIGCSQHLKFQICTVINYAVGLHSQDNNHHINIKNSIQNLITKSMNAKKQNKNEFQENDPDAPDDTIKKKEILIAKIINGTQRNIIRKIYFLRDGKQHFVDTENQM